MKVAIITDTHFGVRNDAPEFMVNAGKFLDDIFFPNLETHGVQKVIHMGDLFDRRRYINYATARFTRERFIEPILERMPMDLMVGNHDCFHKNTNDLNSPEEMYGVYADLHIYTKAAEVMLGDTKALYLPWINPETERHSMQMIHNTDAKLCFGHLEPEGFEMYRGYVAPDGISPALFRKFDMTFSGHYHRKSEQNGFHMLGSHGEFTWSDWNDERGFHILDVEKRNLTFIQNPYTMFVKIHYSDDAKPEFEDVRGKHVKVIVRSRKDHLSFEAFIESIEKQAPANVQIVDDHLNAGSVVDSLGDIEGEEDTLTILRKAIGELEDEPAAMEEFIVSIYNEALSIG